MIIIHILQLCICSQLHSRAKLLASVVINYDLILYLCKVKFLVVLKNCLVEQQDVTCYGIHILKWTKKNTTEGCLLID